jgi:hypothetical protein
MTELDVTTNPDGDAATTPLPTLVHASVEFVRRLPAQRVIDALAKLEPVPFGELQEHQPSRVLAFRALLRDFPGRDVGSLWMHAYDVEVELAEVDPTSAPAPRPSPQSAPPTP